MLTDGDGSQQSFPVGFQGADDNEQMMAVQIPGKSEAESLTTDHHIPQRIEQHQVPPTPPRADAAHGFSSTSS